MKLSIRRGTTKSFALHITPFIEKVDGTVEEYEDLPTLTEMDEGAVYKVLHKTDNHKANSYFRWANLEWMYLGSDTSWADLGTIHIRLKQGSVVIDKTYTDVYESILEVKFSQDETIRLSSGTSATIQIKGVKGSPADETVSVSQEYLIPVLKSLWDEVVHND